MAVELLPIDLPGIEAKTVPFPFVAQMGSGTDRLQKQISHPAQNRFPGFERILQMNYRYDSGSDNLSVHFFPLPAK